MAKSTLAIEWAAQVTMGKAAGALAGRPGHVIISSAEDTEAETLTPRLTAAQAALGKVHFIHLHRDGLDGSLTIPDDIDILREAIQQTGANLVIIDPLMSHLSATLNGWNDQEIRRALTPLARLAEELKVSILVIAHLNKDSKKDAIDRIGGSVGISNTARCCSPVPIRTILPARSRCSPIRNVTSGLNNRRCDIGRRPFSSTLAQILSKRPELSGKGKLLASPPRTWS